MLAVARRYLQSEEDARDAVQEAFLSAYRSLSSFQGESKLSTWLHRIVVNAALMKLRARRRKPEEPIGDLLPKFLHDGHMANPTPAWKQSAESMALRAETRTLVRNSIAKLPESYRTILLLRDIDELDTREVADVLGITPQAVKTRLHRARQALRTLLDPHMREERAS
jgi:RNA polymerase sigma-70 factor (ECF subfamily)